MKSRHQLRRRRCLVRKTNRLGEVAAQSKNAGAKWRKLLVGNVFAQPLRERRDLQLRFQAEEQTFWLMALSVITKFQPGSWSERCILSVHHLAARIAHHHSRPDG